MYRGGGNASGRPGPRHQAVAVAPLPVTAGGVVRRQGDRGAPQRVRRSRGEVGMSPRLSVAARIADALRPAAVATRALLPCTPAARRPRGGDRGRRWGARTPRASTWSGATEAERRRGWQNEGQDEEARDTRV